MSNLWHKRSVGIKLWGFDENPQALADKFAVESQVIKKGDPHGTKNFYKENQIHFLKLVEHDDYWGDELIDLLKCMGGVDEIRSVLHSVNAKKVSIIINKPISDFSYHHSNGFSGESLETISKLKCEIAFNFF